MRRKTFFTAAAVLTLALPCVAQMDGGPRGPGARFGGRFGPGFGHGKLVTGAPYSATLSNQTTQHLADGTTIQRSTTGQVARDSVGRTYEQLVITGGPFRQAGTRTLTFISDPVAGVAYTLDPSTKTAVQRPFSPKAAHEQAEESDARPRANRSNAVESNLAPDTSSGVSAEGKSITHTIPAGAMGNSQPIVSTTQTWYSQDLQIVVKSLRNDPFVGQSNYALTNIATKEPDAALFKVPEGYTIKAAESHGGPRRALPAAVN
jgi:hypothetical protein